MDPDNVDRLQHLIEARRSSCAPFDPAWRVSPRELATVVDAARWAPALHDAPSFRLIVVDDPEVLDELGQLRAPTGPGTAPLDPPRLRDVIAGASTVIVVIFDAAGRGASSEAYALGLVSLGCVLENMWLAAQALHLDVQPLTAFTADSVEPQVRCVLDVPMPWRIAYAVRLGHAVAPLAEPRAARDLEAIVDRNRFRCGRRGPRSGSGPTQRVASGRDLRTPCAPEADPCVACADGRARG